MLQQTLIAHGPLLLPIAYLLAALLGRAQCRWAAARVLSTGACVAAAALAAAALASPAWAAALPPVSLVMAVLVSFMAFVLIRFSERYLDRETREARYLVMLNLTVAAVATVVITDHMLVLLAAWVTISLTLHQLLLFYPERPRAALAAHKKFLFARIAEAMLLISVLLLYSQHDTWQISEVVAAYPVEALSPAEHVAALLLAGAALIKCAQLPVHGWLIQVVEAPTPVSALLHAGIVNLGGYLLILFAPLLAQATAAQWLLLVVAGATTVVAALVMSTRISIKVKLAWSTCAQMGLMLVECALGLFELALLHLTAHACYKAHAFLNAGAAVEQHLLRRLVPGTAPAPAVWLTAVTVALPIALAGVLLIAPQGPYAPWLLLAAALTVVVAERSSAVCQRPLIAAAGVAAGVALLYMLQKAAAGLFVPALPMSAGPLADVWAMTLIAALFAGYVALRLRPRGLPARRVSVWLFGGLYLDEWVTRTTLRIWPTRLPPSRTVHRFQLATEE